MRVKKFRAIDRATALKQIKAEMGAHAVILQEQQVKRGPLGMFGKPEVEILAAIEEDGAPLAARPERPAAATKPARSSAARTGEDSRAEVQATISSAGRAAVRHTKPRTAVATEDATGDVPSDGASRLAAILAQLPKDGSGLSPEVAANLADTIAQAADGKLGDLLSESANAPTNGKSAAASRSNHTTASAAPAPAAPRNSVLRDMQRTLADLRSAVERITQHSQPAKPTREPAALRTIYQHLMEQEVEPGAALDLMGQIAEEFENSPQVDLATVRGRLQELLRERLPARSLTERAKGTRSPHVIVVVGPTGVGKTTTVAKLAAYLSLQDARQVCLVTTDTFRIAAAAQLGTYADIMRLPLEVVYAAGELPEAIGKHTDADYVIVDTPGCGQRNEPQLRELAAFVTAATGSAPSATVLLAVAAPTKLTDMLEVQDRFGALPLNGLILTKLDETTAYGPLLSLVQRAARPVYYITTGQNVPNDIEEPTSDRLAHLLVDSAGASR